MEGRRVTKKGVRSVLPVPMVGTLLVFCGIDHALASSYNARGDLASHQGQLSPPISLLPSRRTPTSTAETIPSLMLTAMVMCSC